MEAVNVEGCQGGPPSIAGWWRAINTHAVDCCQLLIQVGADFIFVLVNCVHAQLSEVLARSAHPNGLTDGRCACLKPQRRRCIGAVVQEYVLDHLSTAHPRRHALENRHLAPQKADPGRTAHFVRGRYNPVCPERLHVYGHVRHGLA